MSKQWKIDRSNNDKEISGKSGTKRTVRPTVAALLENQIIQEFNRPKKGHGKNLRLGGDLSILDNHIRSVKISMKHPNICKVYVLPLYYYMPVKGNHADMACFFDYHYDSCFSLAHKVSKTKKSEWVYSTVTKKK